jgi:VanZ family protein
MSLPVKQLLTPLEHLAASIDQKYWRALFWLFWTVCTVLLLLPGNYVPNFNIWDKLEHAGIFVPMLWLALLGYAPRLQLTPLAITLQAYGIAIEFLQYFIPGRSCSGLDMLADATGIAAGSLAVLLWRLWMPLR